jgi:hypothetical protein
VEVSTAANRTETLVSADKDLHFLEHQQNRERCRGVSPPFPGSSFRDTKCGMAFAGLWPQSCCFSLGELRVQMAAAAW